jgi:hypothetical protein
MSYNYDYRTAASKNRGSVEVVGTSRYAATMTQLEAGNSVILRKDILGQAYNGFKAGERIRVTKAYMSNGVEMVEVRSGKGFLARIDADQVVGDVVG